MTASYLDQIDHHIRNLNVELAELEIAKRVINRLEKPSGKAAQALRSAPTQVLEGITIRKLSAPEGEAPPLKHKQRRTGGGRKFEKRIIAVLTAHKELPSGDIIATMGFSEKLDKQRVYAALSSMIKKGALIRDDQGFYRLAKEEAPPAGPPAEGEQAPEDNLDGSG